MIKSDTKVLYADIWNIHNNDWITISQNIQINKKSISTINTMSEFFEKLFQGDIYQQGNQNTKINYLRLAIQVLLKNKKLINNFKTLVFCNTRGRKLNIIFIDFCILREITQQYEDNNIEAKGLISLLEDFSFLIEYIFSEEFILQNKNDLIEVILLEYLYLGKFSWKYHSQYNENCKFRGLTSNNEGYWYSLYASFSVFSQVKI